MDIRFRNLTDELSNILIDSTIIFFKENLKKEEKITDVLNLLLSVYFTVLFNLIEEFKRDRENKDNSDLCELCDFFINKLKTSVSIIYEDKFISSKKFDEKFSDIFSEKDTMN
jgi:hypothetical protein